jgi:hypothetical protein
VARGLPKPCYRWSKRLIVQQVRQCPRTLEDLLKACTLRSARKVQNERMTQPDNILYCQLHGGARKLSLPKLDYKQYNAARSGRWLGTQLAESCLLARLNTVPACSSACYLLEDRLPQATAWSLSDDKPQQSCLETLALCCHVVTVRLKLTTALLQCPC